MECTIAELAELNPGFGWGGLEGQQYRAAAIYFKVLELQAVGGTDYRSTLTALIEDARELAELTPDQQRIAHLNIARNNAITAGADVPDNLSDLNALTACFCSDVDMDAIDLLLACRLGNHTGL